MDELFSEDVECVETIGDIAIFNSNNEDLMRFKGENGSKYATTTPNRANRLLEFTEIVNSIHSDKKVEVEPTVCSRTRKSRSRKASISDYSDNDDDSDWEESENIKKKRLIRDHKEFKQNLQHVDKLFKLVDKIGSEEEVEITPTIQVQTFIDNEWPIKVKIVLVDQFGKIVKDSKLERFELQKEGTCEELVTKLGRDYGLDSSLWNLIKIKLDDEIVDRATIFGSGTLDLEEGVQIDVLFPQNRN